MNRRLLIGFLALLPVLPLAAQGPMRGMRGGDRPGDRLEFLAGYLDLTDAQKTAAEAIFDAASKSAETALGQLTSARDSLRAAVKANAGDAELDRLAAAAGVIEGQLAAIRAKAEAKFYALLTTEQKAKYDSMGERAGRPRP